MRGSLAALKSYFDGPPQLLSAVSDPQDQAVQVMVAANLQGQRVRGVAFAVVAQGGAAFGLIFDRPELLPSSFQTLSSRLGQEIPAGPRGSGAIDLTSPREWKRQTAGDRSAAVDLPPGSPPSSFFGPTQAPINLTSPLEVFCFGLPKPGHELSHAPHNCICLNQILRKVNTSNEPEHNAGHILKSISCTSKQKHIQRFPETKIHKVIAFIHNNVMTGMNTVHLFVCTPPTLQKYRHDENLNWKVTTNLTAIQH